METNSHIIVAVMETAIVLIITPVGDDTRRKMRTKSEVAKVDQFSVGARPIVATNPAAMILPGNPEIVYSKPG